MKYILYIVVSIILYRLFFKQTVVVEHRHFYDEKPKRKPIQTKNKSGKDEYVDYEEVN